ncbi:CHASE domain-containing protein [Colwellia sp. BRX10-3]|uniref:CHASE domain-containing protein n=1 Tax=Colwellia sp. BRX10-3 TaxID=2759844 RepID=UPI0015F53FE2|nr:CHASE domain-containing protein [Colwellia sp. BRX10-3]MBA6391320.1 CHASE domain-containing protein [Colwellia sp. BRX10-3]
MKTSVTELTHADIQRQKLIDSSQFHGIHWLILALSSILTIGAWYIASEQVNKRIAERFERESLHVIELVKERMQLYEHALWSAVAYVDASEGDITNQKWQNYSNSLRIDKTYPGINGLGLIYNVKHEERNSFIRAQQQTRPNFAIKPSHNEDELWPITYIEPLSSNKQAVGLDVAFEKNRYFGVKNARDTGLAQLTGPITLVQDAKKTPGFLFYAPFYKKGMVHNSVTTRQQSILGVAYAPFIMSKLISGTLSIDQRHVSLKISDAGQSLYNDMDNDMDNENKIDPEPLFIQKTDVKFYGRVWQFTISSNLYFRDASGSNQPYFILAGGIAIDLLLLALFIVLSRSNKQALAYGDEITRELKINTRRLIKSNQDLEQFAYVASHDLKSPLNAIRKLISWISEDCEKILPDSSKEHLKLLNNRSERMNKLLDDLLDYARIGRHEYKANPLDLKATAQEIFSLLDHPKAFDLSVDKQVLLIPRTPIEIVLRNLISNAIKHHDKLTGHIKISYKAVDNMHHISVEDDGPGIPSELFDKAVEMFQTLRPRDKVEGSGMGLSLSKKTIEHYGGSLIIESDGIRGTTIVVIWPMTTE